jgi:NADH pyrophosphatase NudC (nudix superfamily)
MSYPTLPQPTARRGIAMKYCPQCRNELARKTVGTTERLICSSATCEFVHWNNPTPVVAGLVQLDGKCVLGRGEDWPAGLFSMFTGFLERGETPEQGITREIKEELGLEATRTEFIGHFPLPQLNQLIIAYSLEVHGELALNNEIAEVKLFTAEDLDRFNFGPLKLTREVVDQWRRLTSTMKHNS